MEKLVEGGKFVGAGAAAGAGLYGAIGGIGVTILGTAVGVTLGPMVAIGSGLGLVGYGFYSLGKRTAGQAYENRDST